MRKSFLTFILFNMCLYSSMAQDSTRANLYPLQDGNYWEYDSYIPDGFPGLVFTASHRVIGDTLMPNGNTYKKIRQTNLDGFQKGIIFRRMNDSLDVLQRRIVNDSELLRFKLGAQLGEKWFPIFPDSSVISEVVDSYVVFAFGKERKAWEMTFDTYPNQVLFETYILLEGIGMVFWGGEGFYWTLRGAVINGKKYGITAVKEKDEIIPVTFKLFQNYPNPFNGETTIRYKIPGPGAVVIVIYDMAGREVIQLMDRQTVLPGEYSVTWNGRNSEGIDSSSGVYWVQFRSGTFINTKKMILLR